MTTKCEGSKTPATPAVMAEMIANGDGTANCPKCGKLVRITDDRRFSTHNLRASAVRFLPR